MVGKSIGNYEILEKVRRGGMGVVYRARHRNLGSEFAVKVLLPEIAEDPENVELFFREAKMAAKIQDSHVVRVSDFDRDQDGQPYLVMEFLDGVSLSTKMSKGRLEPAEALRIVADALAGLAAVHAQGVVHRDLKPSNIHVTSNGRVVLTDFGIARPVEGGHSTLLRGTAAYMSPEHALNKKLDARSDLYSMGIVLLELVAGEVPFRADTPVQVLYMHANEPVRIPMNLPIPLQDVLRNALEKDPARRFQSAVAMRAACLRAMEALHPEDSSVDTRPWKAPATDEDTRVLNRDSKADEATRVKLGRVGEAGPPVSAPAAQIAVPSLKWGRVGVAFGALAAVVLWGGGYFLSLGANSKEDSNPLPPDSSTPVWSSSTKDHQTVSSSGGTSAATNSESGGSAGMPSKRIGSSPAGSTPSEPEKRHGSPRQESPPPPERRSRQPRMISETYLACPKGHADCGDETYCAICGAKLVTRTRYVEAPGGQD